MNAKLDPKTILPCILTCPVNPGRSGMFFRSYEAVAKALFQTPIVVMDLTAGVAIPREYSVELERCLSPREIIPHERSQPDKPTEFSVEDAVALLLRAGVEIAVSPHSPSSVTHLMFMEDDFAFLPNFTDELAKVDPSPDRGFTTFWHAPSFKVSPDSNEIEPSRFWGAQCLLFPVPRAMELVLRHDVIKNKFPKWWDMYWSRFFASEGIKMYCTNETCVQEFPGPTRLRLHGI